MDILHKSKIDKSTLTSPKETPSLYSTKLEAIEKLDFKKGKRNNSMPTIKPLNSTLSLDTSNQSDINKKMKLSFMFDENQIVTPNSDLIKNSGSTKSFEKKETPLQTDGFFGKNYLTTMKNKFKQEIPPRKKEFSSELGKTLAEVIDKNDPTFQEPEST